MEISIRIALFSCRHHASKRCLEDSIGNMTLRSPTAIGHLLTLLSSTAKSHDLAPTSFQDGERRCALGDSITEGGGYHQKAEWFFMSGIPARPVDVITCGIRGDTATGANQHFISDCLDTKPTVVSVMFGRNAVWRSFFEYQESPDFAKEAPKLAESYERDVSLLTRSLVASEVRAIFIKPSLLDDTAVPVSCEFQLRSIPAISPVNPEV